MESWRFVNYSSLSPPFALSLTTERWGLEPFPGNLVGSTGYWQDIKGSNNTLAPVWTSPGSCPTGNNTTYTYYKYGDSIDPSHYADYNSVTNISASADLCLEPHPCAESGCIILIEGIGKDSTGPLRSSIVGLAHGISSFLVIVLTVATAIAITMGCCSSSQSSEGTGTPSPRRPVAAVDLGRYMNPPPRRGHKYAVQTTTGTAMAKDVARCSDLFRQMYAIELGIWGMKSSVAEDSAKREELERKANALFAEIGRNVRSWRSSSGITWSAEERRQIEEIGLLLDRHGEGRY